jgi:hypothetical protein
VIKLLIIGAIAAVAAGGAVATILREQPSKPSVYWGAYVNGTIYGRRDSPWDSGTVERFQDDTGKKPSILHYGQPPPWEQPFDAPTANLVEARGDIPAIDMSTKGVALGAIAAGRFDSSISAWAQAAKAWGHPFFLLLNEEMNGTWYPYSPGHNGNTAADFVAAWRHMHDVFVAEGATNVTWVWCPNVIDPSGRGTPLGQLYPGDAYVDWVGLNGYNWGGKGWQSFAELFGPSYEALRRLAPAKPILIGETASAEAGGSKAAWITNALAIQLPHNFPQIKALLWFNWRVYDKGAWREWPIESSPAAQKAFAKAIGSPYYASGGKFGQLPLLGKVQPLSSEPPLAH